MMTLVEKVDPAARLRQLVAAVAASSDPAGSRDLASVRADATQRLSDSAFPTRRDEAWRYTNLDQIAQNDFSTPATSKSGAVELGGLPLAADSVARLVFVDGVFRDDLSHISEEEDAVRVLPMSKWLSESNPETMAWLQGVKDRQVDFFENLNASLLGDGYVIDVPAGVNPKLPFELVHISTGKGENVLSHPRHLVRVGDGAGVRLIEQHMAVDAGAYFKNQVLEIELGEGARVVHERLQEESDQGHHLSTIRVNQQADSDYRMVTATLGGAWVRSDIRLGFYGTGANAEFDGFYLAGDGEVSDLHLYVDHAMPHCTSREDFKGILDGRGRAVFDGCVHVAKDAQKTDARLSNHNLMLTRKAEVDTKPQLEIEADDVSCSHGTTVGQLDEQMLFYLRSRGIGLSAARQMLCRGFASEVFDAYETEALAVWAADRLGERLVVSEDVEDSNH